MTLAELVEALEAACPAAEWQAEEAYVTELERRYGPPRPVVLGRIGDRHIRVEFSPRDLPDMDARTIARGIALELGVYSMRTYVEPPPSQMQLRQAEADVLFEAWRSSWEAQAQAVLDVMARYSGIEAGRVEVTISLDFGLPPRRPL